MVPAADAILLDSTRLTLDEVVDELPNEVMRVMASTSPQTGKRRVRLAMTLSLGVLGW